MPQGCKSAHCASAGVRAPSGKAKGDKVKIEQVKTSELIPYARNAKLHNAPGHIEAIAGSIKEFGFTNPVLIGEDNSIIAGHGRVLAAQVLKMAKVPCIRLGYLTDNQRRAYIIADNRLAETGGGWDRELLDMELAEIDWGELDNFGLDDLGDFDWPEVGGDKEPISLEDEQGQDSDAKIMHCPKCGFQFEVGG